MAVISRSTAAQAAAVPHPQHELQLTKAACARSLERIRTHYSALMRGSSANGDKDTVEIAKAVLGAGKCLAEHPLRV
jgi:hypothetical protein